MSYGYDKEVGFRALRNKPVVEEGTNINIVFRADQIRETIRQYEKNL